MADLEPRLLTNLQTTLQQMVDPFGMLEACWGVQKAWLAHPQELAEQLKELHAGIAMLQVQVLNRLAGMDGADVTAFRYETRLQLNIGCWLIDFDEEFDMEGLLAYPRKNIRPVPKIPWDPSVLAQFKKNEAEAYELWKTAS